MTVRVVDCAGSPRERGRAHGEELRELIEAGTGRWLNALAGSTGRDPHDYVAELLTQTDFTAAVRTWTPDLADEVVGIAEGSGLPVTLIEAYQLLDEQWFYEARSRRLASADAHHCSSLAFVRSGRGPLLAQNMDIPASYNGTQVVLRVHDDAAGTTTTVLTAAGMIALTGHNDAGVGVCVNTLMQLSSTPRGLPVAYAIRGLLTRRSAADAAAFLSAVDHASGQNFLVAGADGIIDLEACADGVTAYSGEGGPGMAHTNHPLASDHLDRTASATEPEEASFADSQARLDFVRAAVDALGDDAGAGDVQDILRDRRTPICRVPEPGRPSNTFGSVVMELGADPVLYVAPGQPHLTAYEVIRG